MIEQGFFEHPWIGFGGTTQNAEWAETMNLDRDQQGALVIDVVPGCPAENAGLIGGDRMVTIDDQEVRLGGDVIIRVDEQPVHDISGLPGPLY